MGGGVCVLPMYAPDSGRQIPGKRAEPNETDSGGGLHY